MASNPVVLDLIAFGQGMVTCVSNASYWQRVTFTWGSSQMIFEGTGERTPMRFDAAGDTVYKLPASETATTMSVLFEYSTTGPGGPFLASRVQDPVVMENDPFVQIDVTSEDGIDGDNNDSYFSVMLLKPLAGRAARPAGIENAGIGVAKVDSAGNMLELHAKTYYNDPNVHGGDEHYVDLIYNSGNAGGVRYNSTGWTILNGSWVDHPGPFGGSITVYVEAGNSPHQGLRSAYLILETLIPYWFTRPTTYPSPSWQAVLHNSIYAVTNVTP